jgi:cyclic pyranopterin monophosphate synthase
MGKLSHVSASGKAQMVDVSGKPDMLRTASAEGHITLSRSTIDLIRENKIMKGDVLTVGEIAGIQGGKKTSELIPLCHPLQISKIDVNAAIDPTGVRITSEARCVGQTGIEMEALTAVATGLLTIWDMCKAVDKEMVIDRITLLKKTKRQVR